VNEELLGTVVGLRAAAERQQAQIDKLVQMSFGGKSERVVTGVTLHACASVSDAASP
jgi:hypothetical protein